MTAPAASAAPEPALYSTYELDVMLTLHDTEAGRASREQLGILGVPEEAEEFVTEAVMSGLRARDRLVHVGGKWVLGEEAQAVAGVLASADRWLGIALARGEAMRGAFIVKAGERVLMLSQDELETFRVVTLPGPDAVGPSVADIAIGFLDQGAGRTVSLRRTDARDLSSTSPLMIHVEEDGSWGLGHLPLTDEGVLDRKSVV